MLSPNGIFKDDTAAWPGSSRRRTACIVFLTDGDMAQHPVYGMYGLEAFDKRVTTATSANLVAYHNARFLAECAEAKSAQLSVWTIVARHASTTQLQLRYAHRPRSLRIML